jgi:molybdate transport system regulatory protein
MAVTRSRSNVRRNPRPRAKVWLEIDGAYIFGRGISDILKAVAQCGSIKEAARSVGKSYRHVWARIKAAEQALGAELVRTQVGGSGVRRSELTALGCDLVRDFDVLRQQVLKLVEREYQRRLHATLDRHRHPVSRAVRESSPATAGTPCRKPGQRED